jgi:hypothetical protein
MLQVLNNHIKLIPDLIRFNRTDWQGLKITRRKPHTYRAFIQFGQYRICLHRFEHCEDGEALYHPHPWPAAFKILKGGYNMQVGMSTHRDTEPVSVASFKMTEGSSYEIISPLTWHAIQPIGGECFTVMINDTPWLPENAHESVRTTKGKDLPEMTDEELDEHFKQFLPLLK